MDVGRLAIDWHFGFSAAVVAGEYAHPERSRPGILGHVRVECGRTWTAWTRMWYVYGTGYGGDDDRIPGRIHTQNGGAIHVISLRVLIVRTYSILGNDSSMCGRGEGVWYNVICHMRMWYTRRML